MRYWVGTHGKSLPAIVLPAHPAMKQGVCPPPIGLLANLSGSPDGALWREHHGQLYQWDMQQAQWKPHPLPGKGHAPITLLGRQLDGEAWARAGSLLLKLGAGGVQVREVAGLERFPVVRMDTAGRPLALDGQGQLWRPDLRKAAPRPIRLQLADGRPAFEPVQLGKPDQPVTRARARDFALAPDGRTVFVRDQQGHLYQGISMRRIPPLARSRCGASAFPCACREAPKGGASKRWRPAPGARARARHCTRCSAAARASA